MLPSVRTRCSVCSMTIEFPENAAQAVCRSCGRMNDRPVSDSYRLEQLKLANQLRDIGAFAEAQTLYAEVLSEKPQEHEARWGSLLCRYGAAYAGRAQIVCWKAASASILEEEDCKAVMMQASEEVRAAYQRDAAMIDAIQTQIRLLRPQMAFDVFVTFGESGAKSRADEQHARDISHDLTQCGYRVFFEPLFREQLDGTGLDAAAFLAIESAKVMVVIGSEKASFEKPRVWSAWRRFLDRMDQGEEKCLIPMTSSLDELPGELQKSGFLGCHDSRERLKEKLAELLPQEDKRFKLVRIYMDRGSFEKADAKLEEMLDDLPENPYVWLYKAMAGLKIRSEEDLCHAGAALETNPDYQTAMTFAASDLLERLQGYLAAAMEEVEEEDEEEYDEEEEDEEEDVEDEEEYDEEEDEEEDDEDGASDDDFEWEELPDGSVIINGYYGFAMDIEIPSVLQGGKVTQIGEYAFSGKDLTSVIIPEGITVIHKQAFQGCDDLSELELPAGVLEIGHAAFSGCSSLTKISIPDGVTEIGDEAFKGCSDLEEISIPDTVQKIGDEALSGCSSLMSVTLPKRLTSIPFQMFCECSSLEEMVIPDSVRSIGEYAFQGCASLVQVRLPAGVTSIGLGAFCECPYLESVNIPEGISLIEDDVFSECASLMEVHLPASVKSIGENAFFGCSSLTRIVLPAQLTAIHDKAFEYCEALERIVIPESVKSIGEWVFDECPELTIVGRPGSAAEAYANENEIPFLALEEDAEADSFDWKERPDRSDGSIYIMNYQGDGSEIRLSATIQGHSVTAVGKRAFYQMERLYRATIPEGVTEIEESAFEGCPSLTSVQMPESLLKIGRDVFKDCPSLSGVTIPKRVMQIAPGAFDGCSSLTDIQIPASVICLGETGTQPCNVFGRCRSLQAIHVDSGNNMYKADDGVLYDREMKRLICCPAGKQLQIFWIPSTVSVISAGAFAGCSSFGLIDMPSGLVEIGDRAFEGCTSMQIAAVPEHVQWIGSRAFAGCTALGYMTAMGHVTRIEDGTFEGCTSMTSVLIPSGVTSIGKHAFHGCVSLKHLVIPESVTRIEEGAFEDCEALTDVLIRRTVTDLGPGVFRGCRNIRLVGTPGSAAETYAIVNGLPFRRAD